MRNYHCLLVSDFNVENLAGYLNNGEQSSVIKATAAPHGQIMQFLMTENSIGWNQDFDFIVVWTQPQLVSQSFARALNFEQVSHAQILREVDEFCSLLLQRRLRAGYLFVPSWVIPTYHRGYGLLDMKEGLGVTNVLYQMNTRLAENLKGQPNIFILNTHRWIEFSGKNAFNPKMWYLAKVAFGNEVFRHAAYDIRNFCQAISGQYRKLIIVDLDDTLWGGILGDDGIKNIRLGGHDHVGEAFVDFQKALKALTNKGILLGIVSKNDENFALEAVNQHPEMVLREKDFAGWRINWQDKAQNIIDLAAELNLGLQSVVFIDDNPVERARVQEVLPEIYVPEWPQDKMFYASTLLGLSCFDMPVISSEDFKRSAMYVSDRERKNLKLSLNSYDDWVKTLETKVQVEGINSCNIQRVTQLLNKTNQMNLTTRRLSEEQLKEWVNERNHWMRVIRVSDKFGDSGLTGIMSLDVDNDRGKIVDFILSCRVMGRKIEETMVYIVLSYARDLKLNEIYAEFIPTPKNNPCFVFWKNSGFVYSQERNQFIWNSGQEYHLPSFIKLDLPSFSHESQHQQFI